MTDPKQTRVERLVDTLLRDLREHGISLADPGAPSHQELRRRWIEIVSRRA